MASTAHCLVWLSVAQASLWLVHGWSVTCRATGCSSGGCESNEVEIDSSTCLSGIIPYNDETCCTSTPAGCRWTGCFPGGCDTYHEIEAYKHDCEGLDGFLNNELCCAAPVNQCRWTNPQETCTSAETHVHNGGLLDALLDGKNFCCQSQKGLIGQYVSMAKSFGYSPTLLDLPLVGTHHSPTNNGEDHKATCYVPIYADIARTQELSVLEQLEVGVRAFGFRPHCSEDKTRIQHYHADCRYGDMRTHLAVIDAFLTTHTSEVVVVMFQMFDSFVDSTCEELFQEELQKSFTGTGFLTRDDTASGWPTIEAMVATNKRVMIVADQNDNAAFFDSGVAHSWSKRNSNIQTSRDVAGAYFGTDDVNAILEGVPAFLNVCKEARQADRGSRGQNLCHVHYYVTMSADVDYDTVTNILSPSFVFAGPGYNEFFRFEEWMKITPVNVIWLDYYLHPAHDVGALKMFERQVTRQFMINTADNHPLLRLMIGDVCLSHDTEFDPPRVRLGACEDNAKFKWRMYASGLIAVGNASEALCLNVPDGQGYRDLELSSCNTEEVNTQLFAWNCTNGSSNATSEMELKMYSTNLQVGANSVADGSSVRALPSTFDWTISSGQCPESPEWIVYQGQPGILLDAGMGRHVPFYVPLFTIVLLCQALLQ